MKYFKYYTDRLKVYLIKSIFGEFDTIKYNVDIATAPTERGATWFDDNDRTFNVRLTSSVTANIPTEQLMPRCVNKTGVDISNGEIVYISGVQGQRPTITLADASSYATSSKTIGFATEDIANNAEGFVCRAGYVRDVNTLAYPAGTCVYLDTTAGEFTDTKPNPANGENSIIVGMVIVQHETEGIVCVKIHPEKEWMGDLDAGNYIYWDGNGIGVSKGDGRLYEDIQFSVSTGKVPAANAPNYETFTTNTREYAFDVNEYIELETNELFHGTDFTTTANFHAHLTTKAGNSSGSSQYVKVEVVAAYCAPGGNWTEATFNGELEIPNGTPALHKEIVSINSGTLDLSTIELGGQVKPIIKRIAATGGTEYASQIFITQVGLHVQRDQTGSRTVASK